MRKKKMKEKPRVEKWESGYPYRNVLAHQSFAPDKALPVGAHGTA